MKRRKEKNEITKQKMHSNRASRARDTVVCCGGGSGGDGGHKKREKERDRDESTAHRMCTLGWPFLATKKRYAWRTLWSHDRGRGGIRGRIPLYGALGDRVCSVWPKLISISLQNEHHTTLTFVYESRLCSSLPRHESTRMCYVFESYIQMRKQASNYNRIINK